MCIYGIQHGKSEKELTCVKSRDFIGKASLISVP